MRHVPAVTYYGLRQYLADGDPLRSCEIGSEATPDEYVANMVVVFREVKRVLRPDGVLWLNIGDSYYHANPSGPQGRTGDRASRTFTAAGAGGRRIDDQTLKPKDLIGIPWMLAFALRADGWWLRSDIVWAKGRDGDTEDVGSGNCMPESVTDRPTRSHEYVFLLSKSSDYFYDADAIREQWSDKRLGASGARSLPYTDGSGRHDWLGSDERKGLGVTPSVSGRNARSVWLINTTAYPGAHYAVFPERLVERCILAGSSPQACEHCGAPWERVVERGKTINRTTENGDGNGQLGSYGRFGDAVISTRSWQPTCQCDNTGSGQCVVLDPFFGSGTTGRVALRHGRACIGIELNAAYLEQIEQRTNGVQTSMAGVL